MKNQIQNWFKPPVQKITPQCEDLFVRCKWGHSSMNCSDIFKFRKSPHGYCCLFNYIRQFNTLSTIEYAATTIIFLPILFTFSSNKSQFFVHPKNSVEKPKKVDFTGTETALTFVLNTTTSDYYYSIADFVGFQLYILDPDNYPDNQNGGLAQLMIGPNTRSYIRLMPSTILSKSAIEQYTPTQRGCLFEHELFDQYAGHYSFVDCLLKCKLRSVIELCGCIPWGLPTNFPDGTTTSVKCTLAHNKCLNRYKCNFTHVQSWYSCCLLW